MLVDFGEGVVFGRSFAGITRVGVFCGLLCPPRLHIRSFVAHTSVGWCSDTRKCISSVREALSMI